MKGCDEYIPPGPGERQRDGIGSGGRVVCCVLNGSLVAILGSGKGWISFLCPVSVSNLAQSTFNRAWRGGDTGL